jgi:hypothetical protein
MDMAILITDGDILGMDGAIRDTAGDTQVTDGAIQVMATLDTDTLLLTLTIIAEEDPPMLEHTITAAIAETTMLEIIPIAETAAIVEITATTEAVPIVETVIV